MKLLLKNALLFDASSPHNGKRVDIAVQTGIIKEVGQSISARGFKIIESKDLCVSPGWIDIGAFNGEPGFEQREDLHTLKEAAAAGGFSCLAPFPNSNPVGDTKSQIESLVNKNDHHPVKILPIGAVTKNAEGKELAELYDLKKAGAIAFSDGVTTSLNRNQLSRVLMYLKGLDAILIYPFLSRELSPNGQLNEGLASTSMGMEGLPQVEEEISAFEILKLTDYTGGRVHVHNISTSSAILTLATDKSNRITGSVPYKNLVFSEFDLRAFDVHLKLIPPLRDQKEKKLLVQYVNKGLISVINSNHMPVNEEEKDREFGQAAFGSIGLETCFKALNTFVPEIKLSRLVECLSTGGYRVLGLEVPSVQTGHEANMTLFDPGLHEIFDQSTIKSKSFNSPFFGKKLKGKIIGIINKEKTSLSLHP